MNKTIKEQLTEFKNIETIRSDIESLAYTMAYNLNKDKISEIENVLLLFYDNELNINESKRYLLDLIKSEVC